MKITNNSSRVFGFPQSGDTTKGFVPPVFVAPGDFIEFDEAQWTTSYSNAVAIKEALRTGDLEIEGLELSPAAKKKAKLQP